MEEFPSNSHKQTPAPRTEKAAESKRVEKVVVGEVVRQRKPMGRRFLDTFFGGDAKGVVGFVMTDVLLPAVRDMIVEGASQGIERLIFGEGRSPSRRAGMRPSGNSGYVSYNRYSSPTPMGRREEPREISRRGRGSFNFDEIILETRAEAQEVIDRLFDLLQRYESVSVNDLYELVGVSGDYAAENWGWTDLRGAGITRVRNGYLLDLPKPEQLK